MPEQNDKVATINKWRHENALERLFKRPVRKDNDRNTSKRSA